MGVHGHRGITAEHGHVNTGHSMKDKSTIFRYNANEMMYACGGANVLGGWSAPEPFLIDLGATPPSMAAVEGAVDPQGYLTAPFEKWKNELFNFNENTHEAFLRGGDLYDFTLVAFATWIMWFPNRMKATSAGRTPLSTSRKTTRPSLIGVL